MAEAVRRLRETGGSDIVRRLIARPIRLEPPRFPAQAVVAPPAADEPADAFDLQDAEARDLDEDDAVEGDGVVERLQAEMALMKAILMAERAEAAALRARMELHREPEPIGDEARATRDRWAGMVDRILLAAR